MLFTCGRSFCEANFSSVTKLHYSRLHQGRSFKERFLVNLFSWASLIFTVKSFFSIILMVKILRLLLARTDMFGKECGRVHTLQSPAATKVPIKPLQATNPVRCSGLQIYRVSVSSHEHRANAGKAGLQTIKSRTPSKLSNRCVSVDEKTCILLNKMIIGHRTHKGLLSCQSLGVDVCFSVWLISNKFSNVILLWCM